MHACHIVSKARGGKFTLSNLKARPFLPIVARLSRPISHDSAMIVGGQLHSVVIPVGYAKALKLPRDIRNLSADPGPRCERLRPTLPHEDYNVVDVLTPEQRRLNMSRIRGRDTKPELLLRRGSTTRRFIASGVLRFEARPRSRCRSALSPSLRSRFSSVRTQRSLSPISTPACFWVMCRFLTSCSTFSRSRSFADIHNPSRVSAMSHQSGTF